MRGSQDCDVPYSSGLRISSAPYSYHIHYWSGKVYLSNLHPNPYPWALNDLHRRAVGCHNS